MPVLITKPAVFAAVVDFATSDAGTSSAVLSAKGAASDKFIALGIEVRNHRDGAIGAPHERWSVFAADLVYNSSLVMRGRIMSLSVLGHRLCVFVP